jgi:hypothetical protein
MYNKTKMPYAIIQRDNSPDIVIKADTTENAYCLALGVIGMGTRGVADWNSDNYNRCGSFKICEGVYIKSDGFSFSTYDNRGVCMWLSEKMAKLPITPETELRYFTEKALCSHYLLGANLYKQIRDSILEELKNMNQVEKIERLIEVINERYYYKNGHDEYGRYTSLPKSIKAPYNFFEMF